MRSFLGVQQSTAHQCIYTYTLVNSLMKSYLAKTKRVPKV